MTKRPLIFWLLAATVLVACTDKIDLGLDSGQAEDADGIRFSLGVVEQADLLYQLGQQTRAAGMAPDSSIVEANTFVSHPLVGGSADLQVHRMPLPLVGIHPRTVWATASAGDATRAAMTDAVSDGGLYFHDSLTVWGCVYNPTEPIKTTDEEYDKDHPEEHYHRFLFKSTLEKKIRGWRTSVHWPYDEGRGKWMKFYAIAPALESLEDLTIASQPAYDSSSDQFTPPTFTYKVPDVAMQRDLLFGSSEAVDVVAGPPTPDDETLYPGAGTEKQEHLGLDDKIVGLQFRHILTAVRFAQGKMPKDYVIKRIELTNIQNEGTYNPATPAWSGQTGSVTYTMNPFKTITAWNEGENVYVNDSVLFLLPQTLTASQKLRVTLAHKNDLTSEHIVSADLTGDTWQPGYTVTYKITIGELKSDYYLVVQKNDAEYSTSGGKSIPVDNSTENETQYTQGSVSYDQNTVAGSSGSFTVHSFCNYKDYSSTSVGQNKHTGVNWEVLGFADTNDDDYETATYTLDNAHAIAWLTSFTGWDGSGSATEQSVTDLSYTMAAQAAVHEGNHQTILAGNTPVGSATGTDVDGSYFNLSTNLPNGGSSNGDKMTGYTGKDQTNASYNSANSYIVNAPGSYKFPLVYGNSRQGGSTVITNPDGIFKDHIGNAIAHANILEQVNSVSPDKTDVSTELTSSETSAGIKKKIKETRYTYGLHTASDITCGLVWQDVTDLFSGVNFHVSPTRATIGFISFTVGNTPQPGNCLIALYGKKSLETVYRAYDDDDCTSEHSGDGYPTTATYGDTAGAENEILWVWHIWCTDEIYPNANPSTEDVYYPQYAAGSKVVTLTHHDATSRILPVNLGWVPEVMAWKKYEPREIWAKIAQVAPNADPTQNEVIYLKLRQEARQDLVTGTSMVYQWGRPTPLDPKILLPGKPDALTSQTAAAVADFLKYPDKKLAYGGDAANWWNTTAGDYAFWGSGTKTLYDPCPVGYQLPSAALFKAFSMTPDTDPTSGFDLNMWDGNGISASGGYFYATAHTALTDADRYGPMVYMPVTGCWVGTSRQHDDTGYFWTYGRSGKKGIAVQIRPQKYSPGFIKFSATNNYGDALPVRPVAE